jgi:hypothetical protein
MNSTQAGTTPTRLHTVLRNAARAPRSTRCSSSKEPESWHLGGDAQVQGWTRAARLVCSRHPRTGQS